MAISTRRPRGSDEDVWPGFVDALSQLVMIIVFVLMMFTAAQFYLSSALSGRNTEVSELSKQLAELQAQLGLITNDRDKLSKSVSDLSAQLQIANAERDRLTEQVATLSNKADDATAAARTGTAELQARLGAAQQAIAQRDAKLTEAQSTIDQLNTQILALRQQLEKVVAALDASEAKGNEQQIQIADLGKRLNLALANKVEELAQYRSEFFGRLRAVLGDRPDIRIVGDRFVFQSEVLFGLASADLSDDAKKQLLPVAQALKEIAAKIPPDINWVLRVDGHTDKRPINTPQFPSNWELSTARAISVVRFFIDQGIPANRLAAAGFADNQPLDPGNDEAAFRRNRRIELKLTER
ncbi:MAG TPA: peptidoglycan -binding protein [Stellaceae bacterium]|nr:peptidoglycan -binding protein [Stellaceae bacterium]